MTFTLATGCGRGLCRKSCSRSDHQLNVYDWLADIPGNNESTDLVEVQFKNTRKGYYHNINSLDLKKWADQCATLGREKQIRMLEAFQRLTREYFMYNFHQPELTYMTGDEENFAKKFSPFINENNIIGMYELFQRVIRDIGQNANPKIQFFDLTMKMAVFIHKQK